MPGSAPLAIKPTGLALQAATRHGLAHHTAPRPAPPTRSNRAPPAPLTSPRLADTTNRSTAHPLTWSPRNLAAAVLLSRMAALEERLNELSSPIYRLLTAVPEPSTVHSLQDEIGAVEYKAHSILGKHRRLTSQPLPRGSNDLSKIIVRAQTAQCSLHHLSGITENPTTYRNKGPRLEPSPPLPVPNSLSTPPVTQIGQ